MPAPTTILRQFLGIASTYRRFVPSLVNEASALHKVLKKNNGWIWKSIQQDAFGNLKKNLT